MERHTPRLILREFRPSDYEAVRAYDGSPEVQYYEGPVPGEDATMSNLNQTLAWECEVPRTHYRLAITIRPDDVARGRISLTLNHPDIREWEMGWTVNAHDWGHGYATEAAREMLAFAFGELHAHRVVAFCNVMNTASTRVMEKIGMQQEGRLRETRWWNNGWIDEFVYAILAGSSDPGWIERSWLDRDW
jgi:[ribosomal protein S5]-alanine N-acetyltransferase